MNPLTKFYCQILQSMDCKIAEDGTVLMVSGDKEMTPVMVNHEGKDKVLKVPFKSVLKDSDWDSVIAFHPACENVFDGQSEVLNTLINLANLKLYRGVQTAVAQMLTLAGNVDEHRKLRRMPLEMVTNIGEVSQSTIKYFYQVVSKGTGVSGKHPTLSLKLYRERKIGDVKYDRICKLLTPILEEQDPIYGFKASTKSQQAVKNAYRLAFPEVMEFGTNSKDAPYLCVLLQTFAAACARLNEVKEMMGRHGKEMQLIDLSWAADLANIRKLHEANMKFALPGNTGAGMAKEKDVRVNNPATAPVAQPIKVTNAGTSGSHTEKKEQVKQAIPTPRMPKPITPVAPPQVNIPQISPPVNLAAQPAPVIHAPQVHQPVSAPTHYAPVHQPPQPAPGQPMSVVEKMKQAEMVANMAAYGVVPGMMPMGYPGGGMPMGYPGGGMPMGYPGTTMPAMPYGGVPASTPMMSYPSHSYPPGYANVPTMRPPTRQDYMNAGNSYYRHGG